MQARTLHKLLQPIYRRIRLLFRRGVLTGSNSTLMMQKVQVQITPDLILEMEHPESYGFTSNPQNGAEPFVANVEGKSHPVALLIADRRFRLKNLAKGEVALYTDEGDVIHFKRGNHIYIDSANQITAKATTKVVIDSPLVEFTGNVNITGEATIGGIPFTPHTHNENNVLGGPTEAPN